MMRPVVEVARAWLAALLAAAFCGATWLMVWKVIT